MLMKCSCLKTKGDKNLYLMDIEVLNCGMGYCLLTVTTAFWHRMFLSVNCVLNDRHTANAHSADIQEQIFFLLSLGTLLLFLTKSTNHFAWRQGDCTCVVMQWDVGAILFTSSGWCVANHTFLHSELEYCFDYIGWTGFILQVLA